MGYPIDIFALQGSYNWYVQNGFKHCPGGMQLQPNLFAETLSVITEKTGSSVIYNGCILDVDV